MNEGPSPVFLKKLEERRAREARAAALKEEAAKPTPPPSEYEDLVPDVEYNLSDADKEMDRVVDKIDILDAYARWCGKMTPKVYKGQTENIMCSCPNPAHPDKNPSAWINLDKQTWFCGSCQMGGDAHDIAAFHFGFPVPAYKKDGRFHELRQKMAGDFGFHLETYPGGVQVLVGPSTVHDATDGPVIPEEAIAPSPSADGVSGQGEVDEEVVEAIGDLIDLYDDGDEEVEFPTLDWKAVVPKDTFLWEYMMACTVDDVVEEYHFWHGLIALGFACGRQVRLYDSVPVYGNLFVCTLGRSGSGKSKAKSHLSRLLADAMPHDWTDPSSQGVETVSAPASAETLVKTFQKELSIDPSDPKAPTFLAPVKGLIEFNELSALIGRTSRQGNVLKPTLMQFYDMEPVISTTSLTSGKKEAREPFGSALTTTQPMALKALIGRTDDDSGFLNRWVFVGGAEKKRFAIGGARVDVSPSIPSLKRVVGWAGSFSDLDFVQWSQEAADTFTDFFHRVIEPDKRKPETGALLTRMDLLMKKIILLFSANKQEKIVTAQTVFDAIQCYRYIVQCYGIPAAQIGNTLQNEVSEAILHQARRQWELDKKGITLNQVAKALKRRKYPHDLLLKTMDSLTKLGFLEAETPTQGVRGRPTVRYRYVG